MSAKNKQSTACCGGQAVRLQHKVIDPLCGALVAANSPFRHEHQGNVNLFCSDSCRDDYGRAMEGERVPGVSFECPLHPEFRLEQSGGCPVCGGGMSPVRRGPPLDGSHEKSGNVIGRIRQVLGF